jgi:tyrocidine synthetase-3
VKKLNKKNIEDIFALTPIQQGMLFHYLKDPNSDPYFEQLSLEIWGEIDRDIFAKAWNFVIESNEMLRTIFRWKNVEHPIQIVLKQYKLQPLFFDLFGKQEDERKKLLSQIKLKDRKTKFNLQEVPFRVMLCRREKDKYEMIISNHHILYDGWSNGIILKEFFDAYNDSASGKRLVKPVKTKFKEFVKWIHSRVIDRQKKFWQDYLQGFDTQTVLPIKGIKEKGSSEAENYQMMLPKVVKNRVSDFVKNRQMTLAALFYCAWGILLQKYCNSDDVIFGTTVSGRTTRVKGIENVVGLFINTIPLRLKTEPGEKIGDLLDRINHFLEIRETYENTSLLDIKKYSELGNNQELFDSIIVLGNYPLDPDLMRVNPARPIVINSHSIIETTTYDLTMSITIGEDIGINFSYPQGLFDKTGIQRLFKHFSNITINILEDFDREIHTLEILSGKERKQLLVDFNTTAEEYPRDKTIGALFAEQMRKTPDNAALIFKDKQLSYRQLYEEVIQLAHLLQYRGVQANTPVGIIADRSLEMIVGILAILRAGAAYLPIAQDSPPERIRYILRDSNTRLLLTQSGVETAIRVESEVMYLEVGALSERDTGNLSERNCPGDLAYIIYTSGSSGSPKGVLIEHGSVVNVLVALFKQYPFSSRDTYLLKTSYTFDVSVTELLGWFLGGGRLAVLEPGAERDPGKLLDAIADFGISHINFVPSMFGAFLDILNAENSYKLFSLKYIFLAGEALLSGSLQRFRHLNTAIRLENIYGPTESTIYASSYSLSGWKVGSNIPIGKPLPNIRLYILDRHDYLQPVGVPGELCISGLGLARGYLNQPELTDASFGRVVMGQWSFIINSSYTSLKASQRLYRTGDLARWLFDGNIEFLGRIDYQVKIRGFRIEPGEIENKLLKHRGIKEVVVIAKDDIGGEKYLLGYFVSDMDISYSELREYLLKDLPYYMIPSHFVHVEKIPLTSTGKVDRRALPEAEVKDAEIYMAPRNEIEKKLVEIWHGVLDKNTLQSVIGIDDNFFHLGGHSLKTISISSRIHKLFNVNIPLAEIFKRPTIRGLFDYINESVKERYVRIEPVEEKEYHILSSAQKRLYFLQQKDKAGTTYNLSSRWILAGIVDKNLLEQSVAKLIQRHESLRTFFDVISEEPVQRIQKEMEFGIDYYDHANISPLKTVKGFSRAFDLSKAPLFRAGLVKLEKEKHILMIDIHHIISDGMSAEILIQEFTALYSGEELPAISLRYKDYAENQNREKRSETLLLQGEYWKKELGGERHVLDLPTDYARPAVQCYEGSSINFEICKVTTGKLKELVSEAGATLYMVLMAFYSIFLSKICGQEDLVIGSPVAGRRHADLENIIGMFVNTLALRNYPSGEKTFTDFLAEIKERTLNAFENQEYQYEYLVEAVSITRDASRNPLFDTMLVLQDTSIQALEIPGLNVIPFEYKNNTSKFDLTLTGVETSEKMMLNFEYSTRLFKPETIDRFITYFLNLVPRVLDNKHWKLSEIEIIPEAEKNRILYGFNSSEVKFPEDKTLQQLFAEQVEKTPDPIALTGLSISLKTRGGWPIQVTYRELNRKSNALAQLLRQKGVYAETIVGIKVGRSLEMIIGLLSILKAGGAYLPIDPEYPKERINYILADSAAKILLTTEAINRVPTSSHLHLSPVFVNAVSSSSTLTSTHQVNPANLVYIIYTSGTTGRPRGVPVEHRNAANVVRWFAGKYQIKTGSNVLQMSDYTFDASVNQIFATLLYGGSLYLTDPQLLLDIEALRNYIDSHQIHIINFVPLLLKELLAYEKKLESLQAVISGGEKLEDKTKDMILEKGYRLYNQYGPTETTIDALVANCSEEKVNLGAPIANVHCFILDRYKKLLPVGIVGELYISGAGVARGYLNQPQLTTEKFDHDLWDYQDCHDKKNKSFLGGPGRRFFKKAPLAAGGKLYKTGDLVRWLADGNIEFLGRIDHQVKIRGFRVELGEIESRLLNHDGIREAVVLTPEQEKGDKFLCAYIVSNEELTFSDLWEYLGKYLPDYMIPSDFVRLAQMPMTFTGKIDRRALPLRKPKPLEKYSAPKGKIETTLVEIWSDLLGREKEHIGAADNFFQLGGQSLKATILVSRIEKAFNIKIPLVEIFKRPYIGSLSQYIKDREVEKYIRIEKAEEKEYYPLSSAQKRLYFLQHMDRGGTAYNIPSAWILAGNVDKDNLEQSIRRLIQRHESLRTSFETVDEEPVQKIQKDVNVDVQYYVSSSGDIIKSFIRPFDISKAPLVRVRLVKQEEGKHIFMVDMHHIISDGISALVLVQDFTALYAGNELPELKLHYKDYARWQRGKKQDTLLRHQGEYWKKEFTGEIPVLELPTDFGRSLVQSFEGNRKSFQIGKEISRALKDLALETGATLYMILLAVYSIFLSKLSSQEDIVIGTPIAGRRHADLEKIIGMFVNTLALRTYPSKEKRFMDFLGEVQEKTLDVFENQDYQYEDLVEQVPINRDASRNPLFDAMFVMQISDFQTIAIPGLRVSPYQYENKTSKFDLTLIGVETEEQLCFTFEYMTKLFRESTIERFIGYFQKIISGLVNDREKGTKLWEMEIISAEEKRLILLDFNDTETNYPKDKTLQQLFEEQVELVPDHTAVITSTLQITYGELKEKSHRLAHLLRQKGVVPDTIIVIMVEPSLEMIIGIFGILKAGGAYMPVDPDYPQERIDFMLKDSGAMFFLTAAELSEVIRDEGAKAKHLHLPLRLDASPLNIAYVIYTSGSVGKPKGVMVEHGAAVNLLCAQQDQYLFGAADTLLLKTAYVFDVSITELFGWYMGCGRVVVLEKGREKDPLLILASIEKHRVSHINFVPSMFNAFIEQLSRENINRLSSMKYIFLAGEALLPELVKKFRALIPTIELENIYGPTEGTVYSSRYSLAGWHQRGSIPIGRALPNIRLYILDKYNHLQPLGLVGELCISGIGLARGYLNRPQLTGEKFIPDPFVKGERLYRSGDLVKWLPEGNIEFLGRIDQQVKIRGFRVEPEEIENQLLGYDSIKEIVVVLKEDKCGDKRLVAYYVSDLELGGEELREYLTKKLPDYMIPSHFVQLEEIPLMATGKIHRGSLPEPEFKEMGIYMAPRNAMEEKLLAIWSQVLGIDKHLLGTGSNFFKLGGHSLKATTLISRIHKAFNVKIPLGEIFKRPTVRGLFDYINDAVGEQYIWIEPVEEKEYYPLSSAQKRLYFLQQREKEVTTYNLTSGWISAGIVDKNRLEESAAKLIQRHESIRTSFDIIDEEPVQRIHEDVEFEIEYGGLGDKQWVPGNGQVKVEQEQSPSAGTRGLAPWPLELAASTIKSFIRPFNLSQAPLLRLGLIKGTEKTHIFMVDIHHIISDGISSTILIKEFSALLKETEFSPLRIHYKDYSQWQNKWIESGEIKKQEEYWLRLFESEVPVLNMPTDYTRPAVQSFEGRTVNFEIGRDEMAQLNQLALEEGVTLYMILLSVYNILLSKINNQEDIVVGTPTAGRNHADLEQVIGMFVNTLILKNLPSGEKSFRAFLREVKKSTSNAFENQNYPFEKLVNKVAVNRDLSRNPLFDVMFVFQNMEIQDLDIPGLQLRPWEYKNLRGTSRFDLTLEIIEAGRNLACTFEYCTRLFRSTTIERFIKYFKNIICGILDVDEIRISNIEIISAEEKRQILFDFNDTRIHYPREKSLHELFENQVRKSPGITAVIYENQRLTYKETNEKANRLAAILRSKGVKPDTMVGIIVDRSLEMILGILAILKAGGAYLPMAPADPQERINYMMQDSAVKRVLTQKRFLHCIDNGPEVIDLEDAGSYKGEMENLNQTKVYRNLAYVIYTSGSTGKPKGVMVEHPALVNRLDWMQRSYPLGEQDVILHKTPFFFDVSIWELLWWSFAGAAVCLLRPGEEKNPKTIIETIERNNVTTMHFVPSMLNAFLEYLEYREEQGDVGKLSSLKQVFCSGEALGRSQVTQFNALLNGDHAPKLINLYGPTEAAIDVSYFNCPQEEELLIASIPIGKPINNIQLYVLGKENRPQPLGVAGELFIAGDGLARGYLNRPEMTGEKFTANPFDQGNRMYGTGDLGRWMPDGNVEFLGRIDHQVKIRGYRIELGEIESLLLKHRQIKEAVVLAKKDNFGDKYLSSYFVSDRELTETELREFLQKGLPDYMIPSYFVRLEKIPLTSSGKIDGRTLPEPAFKRIGIYAAPRDAIEEKLVKIWSDILGGEGLNVSQPGIDDNFFQLGGHSLKATTLVYRVYKEFEVEIEIVEVFSHPTIRELAQWIKGLKGLEYLEISAAEETEYYPLSYSQRRLWVLCQFEEDSTAYNMPMAIILLGAIDPEALLHSVQTLVNRHESLRTVFVTANGEPRQKIIHDFIYNLETVDLRGIKEKEREEQTRHLYVEIANGAFDLEKGPLFRLVPIRVEDEKYILVYNIHHIISDGWSQGIIHNELITLYNSYCQGGKNPLLPLRLQYKDYTLWHNRLIREDHFTSSGKYWQEKLKDKPNGIELPVDHPREPVQTFNGGRVNFVIDNAKTAYLQQLSLREDATLFMSLLTLLNIFLYKYTGQQDIIIGAPIANRKRAELNNMVGFLVNTLVYRNRVDPTLSFPQLLAAVKKEALACYEYQDFPFNLLVEQLELDRDLSQSPIFNVMLAHNNTETKDLALMMKGVKISAYQHSEDFNMSKFDLIFFMDEIENRVQIRLEYNSDLFDRSTIERMASNFLVLVEQVSENIKIPASALNIMSREEYETVTRHFNDTRYDFPPLSLPELFQNRVEKSKDKIAVIDHENRITYDMLNKKINRIAHYLRGKYGVKPNDVIGISMDRSIDMIAVIFGVIKSGAAYLALDPTYPRDRVLHVLSDSRSKILIIDEMRPQLFGDYAGEILNILFQRDVVEKESDDNPSPVNHPSDILYVNYTSGSTGIPNGAMLSHDCLTNLIHWQKEKTSIDCSLRCLQFTSINFCVSFQEIMGTLTSGGELYLIGDIQRQDIDYLMDFLCRHQIDILFLPFSYLNFLFNESGRWDRTFKHNLKHIITAGEQLKITTGLKRFLNLNPHLQLHNHYGSTEMHVVTSYTLDAATADKTPIPPAGKPISNIKIFILDEHFNPVPVGVYGELSVAGSTEILGYMGNQVLTDKKLVKCPGLSEIKLYRSGDIGRWLPDGNIELRGRKDFMVKVRGFRVEPGEIESKILSIDRVRECVVVVREDDTHKKYLAAYVSVEGIDAGEIKRIIAVKLPQYMIPKIIILESLPLMPNGKVDREQLPDPQLYGEKAPGVAPPTNEIEKKVWEIWSHVLEIEKEQIGMDDNFFELGGHSLKAAAMMSGIHKQLDVKVELVEIFRTPTIRDIARIIYGMGKDAFQPLEPAEKKEYYLLSPNQKRLFIHQHMREGNIAYNMPTVMELTGALDREKFAGTFQRMIQRHDSLRTSFHIIEGEPVQMIHTQVEFGIEYYSLGTIHELPRQMITDFIRTFDLAETPLLRVGLIKEEENKYILMVDMHHIISDGISIGIFVKEFLTLYKGENLPHLALQYKDYSEWTKTTKNKHSSKKQEKYWLEIFQGNIPTFNLPGDFPRPAIQSFEGDYIPFTFDRQVTNQLNRIAKEEKVSLFMLLLAAYNILLAKLSGQEDIIVGTTTTGRNHADVEKYIIGLFVNTLPLKNIPKGQLKFKTFLQDVKKQTVEAFENSDYPVEDLLEKIVLTRDSTSNPLTDVGFNLKNFDIPPLDIPGLELKPYKFENKTSKADLVLNGTEIENEIYFTMEYRTKLFKRETIEEFVVYFKEVISAVIKDREIKLENISISHDLITVHSKVPEISFGF